MEIIRLSGYTEDEKINIAMQYLVPKQMKRNGVKEGELVVDESAVRDIIRYYTRELAYCFGFGRFFLVLTQGNLHYHFAANFGNFTIQGTDTGLAGVVTDNIAHRTFINHQLALFHTIALHLFLP
jgi:hypothetical protein